MRKIATGRIRREQRQKEAQERNAAYRALSVKDRLSVVAHRIELHGGASTRELARLTKLQESQDAPSA